MESVSFVPTSDPSIFAVEGLSTDTNLIQLIGKSDKPGKAKYFQFRDGVFAVIKERGSDAFRLRAPRSTSSSPAKTVDPLEAYRQLDVEVAQRRAAIRAGMEAKIAGLREELTQAEEALETLEARSAH
jgi:hypothetical protein